MIKTILASLSVLSGVFGVLMFLTLMLAGMPNSKPEQLRLMTRWMYISGAVSFACLVGGIWLIVLGYNGWGALVGALPLIGFVLFVIVTLAIS